MRSIFGGSRLLEQFPGEMSRLVMVKVVSESTEAWQTGGFETPRDGGDGGIVTSEKPHQLFYLRPLDA